MPARLRPLDIGMARARDAIAACAREIRAARLSPGLSQSAVAEAAGISRGRYGRIERGEDRQVSIDELARIGAALGLDLAVRFYPSGDPLRDAPQRAVLERLRQCCHASIQMSYEVPLPIPGDRRAWDALMSGFTPRLVIGVEAESRPTDEQALARKLALKRRDGGVDRLVLILPDTRHNRAFLRSGSGGFLASFPIPGRRALDRLRAGRDPGGDAIIVL